MSDNTSLESIFRLVHSLKRQMSEQIESLDSEIAPMNIRVMKIITKKSPCTAIDIAHFLNRDKAQVENSKSVDQSRTCKEVSKPRRQA